MSDQQHERPFPAGRDASLDPDPVSPASRDGGGPSQLREALKGGPDGEARDSIERATAVVGEDDESDAS